MHINRQNIINIPQRRHRVCRHCAPFLPEYDHLDHQSEREMQCKIDALDFNSFFLFRCVPLQELGSRAASFNPSSTSRQYPNQSCFGAIKWRRYPPVAVLIDYTYLEVQVFQYSLIQNVQAHHVQQPVSNLMELQINIPQYRWQFDKCSYRIKSVINLYSS